MQMFAYDSEHGSDFGISIAAWLDAIGDVKAAATKLGVHMNTLRYRLRRAADLFSLDLGDPDERLAIWLQLRTPKSSRRPHRA
jgi:DNA-binding PucR family transcriptional regulator